MDNKERDQIDDLFQDRLYNFEAETDPADWMAIESRLPEQGKVVSFHKMIKYWSAAAARARLDVLQEELQRRRRK